MGQECQGPTEMFGHDRWVCRGSATPAKDGACCHSQKRRGGQTTVTSTHHCRFVIITQEKPEGSGSGRGRGSEMMRASHFFYRLEPCPQLCRSKS